MNGVKKKVYCFFLLSNLNNALLTRVTLTMLFLLLITLFTTIHAHTPTGTGAGSRKDPVDLGDPTLNSWAITGDMEPNQVFHYKFTITKATPVSELGNVNSKNRFFLGLYVPGGGEPGFTFYTAIFGMSNNTQCTQWGDGWGRRLAGTGDHDHATSTGTAPSASTILPHRTTASGTAWIMDSTAIPESVTGKWDGHSHAHDGEFNYHEPKETLVFIASPATNRPNKFESFSPTLFKPRGSCIADFLHAGEYRMAVWGESEQKTTKKFAVGIGLAERDVFAPSNLITFDYILMPIQIWNGWNPFVMILPILLGIALAFFSMYMKWRDYQTKNGMPTPFRGIVLCVSGLLLGHVIMNISILIWATSNAVVHSGRELTFPLVMGIFMPLLSGTMTLMIGLNVPVCGCCTQDKSSQIIYRIATFCFGFLHLFVHAGYVIGPVLLIVAAILPPKYANWGRDPTNVVATTAKLENEMTIQPKSDDEVPKV